MANPKYVILDGKLFKLQGGPYWEHGYHVLKGN